MSRTTRFGIAVGFVAAVGIAGAAFGNVGAGRPDRAGPLGHGPLGYGPQGSLGSRMLGDLVTGETMFSSDEGFLTRLIDAGPVGAVDGDNVTIERADDQTVLATATEDTRVTRDGARATVSDIKVGDHAFIVRVDRGDGPVVEAIHAVSPERFEQRHEPFREHRRMVRDRLREWRERMRERAREGRAQA
jgi:hypothetical protein